MKPTVYTLPLLIIGTGGFGREVLHLIEDINKDHWPTVFDVIGFLNNDPQSWGTTCNGIEILGDESIIDTLSYKPYVAIGIGNPAIKRKIVQKISDKVKFTNLIHPSVKMSKWNDMGVGNIITEGNIITCNVTFKNHTMLNLACTVGHDAVIDDYAVISPGVNISGYVNIGEGAYIGTGAKILEKLTIGKWATIGGGALVNKDVEDNSTAVGIPARVIKIKNNGWQE